MPIRRERKHLYPDDWPRIRRRIDAIRADWRCEWCELDGRRCEAVQGQFHPIASSKVLLTVAHLDHDETVSDPARLMAMCQMHHNRHDVHHRRRNAAQTRRRQMGTEDLFADVPSET